LLINFPYKLYAFQINERVILVLLATIVTFIEHCKKNKTPIEPMFWDSIV